MGRAIEIRGRPGVRYRLFLGLYGALIRLGEPLIWRYFRRRAAGDERYGQHLEDRRGEGAPFRADLWIHAVSLGEMTSAEPLVRLALDAGYRVLTSHATPAGRGRAETIFAEAIARGQMAVRYVPIDRRGYWARFFAAHSPKVGLVMEMEFWPGMIEAARAAGVKLVLTNSQVPERSFPRARRLARVFGHPVARAALVLAKSEGMAERFRALGASEVEALGETRFDVAPAQRLLDRGAELAAKIDRPVLCLASVVAGEEAIFVEALKVLQAGDSLPFVIWVPRAPEKFAAHGTMLEEAGFKVASRSTAFDEDLAPAGDLADAEILLGDSLGEMFFYLAASDAVIVGGGFIEKGAHNVIEPLSLGKPVLTGPYIWTIEYPGREAVEAGVLNVVEAPEHLPRAIRDAISGGSAAAEAFHEERTGASERIFKRILGELEGK